MYHEGKRIVRDPWNLDNAEGEAVGGLGGEKPAAPEKKSAAEQQESIFRIEYVKMISDSYLLFLL